MLSKGESAQRPRILFVGAFPPADRQVFGGMVSSCRALLQSSFSTRADLVLLDSTQISNPPPGFMVRLYLAVKRVFAYLVQFERQRPDAVLLFASVGASVIEKGAMAWYARIRGVPALIFPRGGVLIDACRGSRLTHAWVRVAIRGARAMLCQGPAWHRFAVTSLGFGAADAPIVPNWTATPALLAIGRARALVAEGEPVRLLFVGWLEEKKGIFELIEACRLLAGSHKFVLNVVGEGNASRSAHDLVAEQGLASIVNFSGWLKGENLERAFANADVLVLPSWAEGLPNAMIEAMAAKLAVVVTSVGNIPDVVGDEREVLLVPSRDIPALKNALARVIEDKDLRYRLADAAFSMAERQFGAEQAANRLLTATRETIRRFGSARSRRKMGC